MSGLNSRIDIDTAFLQKLGHLPDEISKAARRAVSKTNLWLRTTTRAELGYELSIDSKAMNTRFRVYKKGNTSKLWVGVREIGVHLIGAPKQTKDGVQVGGRFFEKAFISPMNSGELLVWRRNGKAKSNIELVKLDYADEAEEIIGSYTHELNHKFKEFFDREFKRILSGAK